MESDRLPVAFHIAATPLGLASDLARRAGLHGRDDAMGAPFSHAQDDSHCDLAWNMLNFGRDYTRSAAETREKEKGTRTPERNGDSLIGWPDYQRVQVAMVFSTLFAAPARNRAVIGVLGS